MSLSLTNLFDNPILLRELRRRMRGKVLIFLMMLYIAILTFVSFMIILHYHISIKNAPIQMVFSRMSEIGLTIFSSISIIQAIFVLFISPLIMAVVITNEKERQTFDFLRVTTISPSSYIWGCLISNLLYVLLVLLCALPIISVSFLFGGIGPDDVISSFFILLSASLLLSLFGLMISSIASKSQISQNIVIGFQALLALFIFTGTAKFISGILFGNNYVGGKNTGGGLFSVLIYFYNIPIPSFFFWTILFLALAISFFLVARRKIFYPENRALTYSQFFIIYIFIPIFFFGFVYKNLNKDAFHLLFTIIFLLSLVELMIFGPQQVEVGNDLWRFKKRIWFFQKFDESPIFFLFSIFLWIAFLFIWSLTSKIYVIPLSQLAFTSLAVLCQIFFFFMILRKLILKDIPKIIILKGILILILSLWIFIPLALTIICEIKPILKHFFPVQFLINVSPVIGPIFKFYTRGLYSGAKIPIYDFDKINIIVFGLLSVILLISYWREYYNVWKNNLRLFKDFFADYNKKNARAKTIIITKL